MLTYKFKLFKIIFYKYFPIYLQLFKIIYFKMKQFIITIIQNNINHEK